MVYLLDLNGRIRRMIGSKKFQKSKEKGMFSTPGSIVVDSKGNFLVADIGNNRIQERILK